MFLLLPKKKIQKNTCSLSNSLCASASVFLETQHIDNVLGMLFTSRMQVMQSYNVQRNFQPNRRMCNG